MTTGLTPSKRSDVEPFLALDMMIAANRRQASGQSVLRLEIGQPLYGAPQAALSAAQAVLAQDPLGYTESTGMPPLREKLAAWYADRYGVAIAPDQVVITAGSSQALLIALLAAFDAGDEVLMPTPCYPAYRALLGALDLRPMRVPMAVEDGYRPTKAWLQALPRRPAGMILCSPSNPTGTMVDRAALADIIDWAAAEGVTLITDEVYHGITFDTPASTAAGCDHAIVINGFSKYYCMTGWRLGWMVVPPSLVPAVTRQLTPSLTVAPPTLAQHAAMAALDATAELDARVAGYRRNRDALLAALPALGMTAPTPDGAFYLYADVSAHTDDSRNWAMTMLDATGVAVTPGVDFDPIAGDRHIRLSYAGAAETIDQAIERLRAWL